MKRKHLARIISGIVGAAQILPVGATYVNAQSDEAEMEEVVITGSRIKRTSADSLGPLTVVGSNFIEQSASINTEEILGRVPAISKNATNANDANGGKGFHFTEIHNLGEERVLVLVNGRRFVSSILDNGLGVDLNNIPSKMIERVEVLADGASAVYGSDAIAGVVNIILKDTIDRPIFEIGGGITSEGDRETLELSGSLGGDLGDKGNYIAGFSFVDRENVIMQDREWSSTPILWNIDESTQLMGSGIPPEGRFSVNGDGYIFAPNGDASYDAYSTFDESKGHRFNYNAGERPADLMSPVSSFNFFTAADFDLSDNLSFFSEASFTTRDGTYQMMGLPISGSHGKYTDMIPVALSNPNIPTDAFTLLNTDPDIVSSGVFNMTWRSQDLGQRFFEFEASTYSFLAGLEGEVGNWSWTGYAGYGLSESEETTFNQVNVTNLRTAVDPVACGADAACSSAFASTGNAIDIFGRNPNFTDAQKNYVLFTDNEQVEYEQTQIAFDISNPEIFSLPKGGVGLGLGVSYRDESGFREVSEITRSGDSGGNFSEPSEGEYDVTEAYLETSITVLEGVEGAEDLTFDLAARFSDYSSFGSEVTYKIGANYSPVSGLSFRGIRSTAFRAPNIIELYGGTSDDYEAVSDPCSNYLEDADEVTRANCIAAGVPDNYIQDAGQLRISKGGNPELEAETADTTTVGIVLNPIENLVFSIDYYNVEVDGAVGEPGSQSVMDRCYGTPGLENSECARLTRNATGTITSFNLLKENLDKKISKGIDFSLSYSYGLGDGELSLTWLGAKLLEYSETTREGVKTDLEGKVFCSSCGFGMYPLFRTTTQVGYSEDKWGIFLSHRYIPEMEINALFGSDDILNGTDSSEMHYLDLSGFVRFGSVKFTAGVENLTDQDPEYIPDISNNTSDGYDWLGAYYYSRLQFEF